MASGTQSPPLEATGEHQPVGAVNKDGKPLNEGLKDSTQRAAYFDGDKSAKDAANTGSGISAEAIAGAKESARNVENKH